MHYALPFLVHVAFAVDAVQFVAVVDHDVAVAAVHVVAAAAADYVVVAVAVDHDVVVAVAVDHDVVVAVAVAVHGVAVLAAHDAAVAAPHGLYWAHHDAPPCVIFHQARVLPDQVRHATDRAQDM